MLLLVGLGNPGPRYAGNRHNIGFMALDEIVRRHGFSGWRKGFQGEVAEGRLGGEKVLALKPLTYMNESGRAVGEALRFYKLTPAAVTVLHDELDLAPGKVRVKLGGGAAGHNGLRSITQHIGPDFKRVRLGIGHPGRKEAVHGWVLSDFPKTDGDWLEPLLEALVRHAELLVAGEDGPFMSRVNQEVGPQKPKAEVIKPEPKAELTKQRPKAELTKQRPKAETTELKQPTKQAEPQLEKPEQVAAPESNPKRDGLLAQALKRALGQLGGKTKT
ncbi:aminoacyl-tRNA hydrolase [Algihabitans albus]|uniref:aminoacyl-tRNA hydrolase n=1 Tax=Algihabitans albus TaxID=2164067 RepID=UPI000E5D7721|nr:aminoacyl-tRNA hydrolase [Algihabitans albus]